MSKDLGASASRKPALVASDEAPSGLHPSGFDPARSRAFASAEVFHPSEYIKDEMAERGWDMCDLAVRMGGDIGVNALALDMYFVVGPTDRCCRIGDVMSHQLGVAFDVSHQYFLNLEAAWLAHPSTQELHSCRSDGGGA